MKKIKNNIPNAVTVSRIISCLLGAVFFTVGNIDVAIGCYIYGAISDACDGFLARKLNAVTELGKKLDPISDKIFALSLMSPSIILGNYSMIIPLVLEGLISGINIYSDIKYQKTYTEKVGKIKTILLFPTMILGLLATKIPYLYAAYLPLMIVTADLQGRSMLAYYNQLEKIKKQYENNNFKEEVIIEKSNNYTLNNEKTEYKNISNDIAKKNTIHKTKKLIRKKEYNDRY